MCSLILFQCLLQLYVNKFIITIFNEACFCVIQGKPVGTPDPSSFYRVLQQHDVAVMFTAPTAMRALRREVVSRAASSRFKRNSLHRRASHRDGRGWVHPWVVLGWVEFSSTCDGLGWVGLRKMDPRPSLASHSQRPV